MKEGVENQAEQREAQSKSTKEAIPIPNSINCFTLREKSVPLSSPENKDTKDEKKSSPS